MNVLSCFLSQIFSKVFKTTETSADNKTFMYSFNAAWSTSDRFPAAMMVNSEDNNSHDATQLRDIIKLRLLFSFVWLDWETAIVRWPRCRFVGLPAVRRHWTEVLLIPEHLEVKIKNEDETLTSCWLMHRSPNFTKNLTFSRIFKHNFDPFWDEHQQKSFVF